MTITNYNKFLATVSRRYKLDYFQAQQVYSQLRSQKGRPIHVRDIKRYSREIAGLARGAKSTKWSIATYNKFIKQAREQFKLSDREARQLYQRLTKSLKKPVFPANLYRHRKLVRDLVHRIKSEESLYHRLSKVLGRLPFGAGEYPDHEVADRVSKRLESEDDWNDLFDEADDYEDLDYEGSGNYRGRKK